MSKRTFLPALTALGLMLMSSAVVARDFILAPARPNKLIVVDVDKMAVEKVITLEDEVGAMPMTPTVDPTGNFGYALINKTESITRVDLRSGETLARADMSHDNIRVKGLFGLAIAPDGRTIAALQSPVKMEAAHFEVQPTRIMLYDAEKLTPIRSFEVPRQITLLIYSLDGKMIYGLGRSLYAFDAQTGALVSERTILQWNQEVYNPLDVLDVWSQYDTSGMMVAPFFTSKRDGDPTNPDTFRTGLVTLDLASDELKFDDYRTMDVFYFSTAANAAKTRAYGVYNVLESFDLVEKKPIKRVALPHTYYAVIVSPDNRTVYISGALGNIAAYDAETLERKGDVNLPGGANMSLSSVRMFSRAD